MSEPTHISNHLPLAIAQIKQRSREHGMTISDEEVIKSNNDVEMIRRPHLWPQYGILPLKKRRDADGELPVGVLIYRDGKIVVAENLTMFGTSFGKEVIERTYEDAESVAMDGWVVD